MPARLPGHCSFVSPSDARAGRGGIPLRRAVHARLLADRARARRPLRLAGAVGGRARADRGARLQGRDRVRPRLGRSRGIRRRGRIAGSREQAGHVGSPVRLEIFRSARHQLRAAAPLLVHVLFPDEDCRGGGEPQRLRVPGKDVGRLVAGMEMGARGHGSAQAMLSRQGHARGGASATIAPRSGRCSACRSI